jgi:hypothetical protein
MQVTTMWIDALACHAIPRLARWTVVVVDRVDGEEHSMPAVRLRWRRSADTWIARMTQEWVRKGMTVNFAARELT